LRKLAVFSFGMFLLTATGGDADQSAATDMPAAVADLVALSMQVGNTAEQTAFAESVMWRD